MMQGQGQITGAAQRTDDNLAGLTSSLEKNFEHACELIRLLADTADSLNGPRPTPVDGDRNSHPQPATMIARLRQADIDINAALAACREQTTRIRTALGMPPS